MREDSARGWVACADAWGCDCDCDTWVKSLRITFAPNLGTPTMNSHRHPAPASAPCQVNALIEDYLAQQRTIILAVIPSNQV